MVTALQKQPPNQPPQNPVRIPVANRLGARGDMPNNTVASPRVIPTPAQAIALGPFGTVRDQGATQNKNTQPPTGRVDTTTNLRPAVVGTNPTFISSYKNLSTK